MIISQAETPNMIRLVDANFFIQAHRISFPLDVVPSFWDAVATLAAEGKICSIDKVKEEIYKNEDALKDWCLNNLPEDFFKDSTICVDKYLVVAEWADAHTRYTQAAKDVFLHADRADAWLVAFAASEEMAICTQEVSSPMSQKHIKIPDACLVQSVSFENTIEMFRALGVRI